MIMIIHLVMLALMLSLALVFAYLAIVERDLLKAVVFSAAQTIAYAITYYLLMVPDIVLAYVAVAVGIYSALLVFAVKKTERYEEV